MSTQLRDEIVVNVGLDAISTIKEVEAARNLNVGCMHLVLDFNKVIFLKTGRFVIIACLIEHFHQLNERVRITARNVSDRLLNYIKNIRLDEYWGDGFKRTHYTKTKIDTALCLWQISIEMIDAYASYAQDFFENNYTHLSLDPLAIAHKEVFNNIFDHSKSPIDGYVLTQRFPSRQVIETAICDFGVGIPTTINNYWMRTKGRELTERNALAKALERSMTVESKKHNRGFGLDNLINQVNNQCGELNIISNSVWYNINMDGSKHFYDLPVSFQGTIIVVRIDENKLPIDEDYISNDLSLEF